MVMPDSGLGWLNWIMPAAPGGRRVAANVDYGTHARQTLDIYAPRRDGAAWPVLIFVYGGGWDSGRKEDYSFVGHAFAAVGYLTIIADYRVHPDVLYPDFLSDCADAAEWAVANAAAHGGDPDRLALAGHSAGAYNAMMTALDARLHAGRTYASSVRAVAGLSGPYDFYPFDVEVSIRSFGGAGAAEESQPVHLDLASAPPIFLAHGTADKTVGLYNTRNLAAALRSAGRTVEEVHFDGVGHGWPLVGLMPLLRWRLPVFERMRDFLDRTLK